MPKTLRCVVGRERVNLLSSNSPSLVLQFCNEAILNSSKRVLGAIETNLVIASALFTDGAMSPFLPSIMLRSAEGQKSVGRYLGVAGDIEEQWRINGTRSCVECRAPLLPADLGHLAERKRFRETSVESDFLITGGFEIPSAASSRFEEATASLLKYLLRSGIRRILIDGALAVISDDNLSERIFQIGQSTFPGRVSAVYGIRSKLTLLEGVTELTESLSLGGSISILIGKKSGEIFLQTGEPFEIADGYLCEVCCRYFSEADSVHAPFLWHGLTASDFLSQDINSAAQAIKTFSETDRLQHISALLTECIAVGMGERNLSMPTSECSTGEKLELAILGLFAGGITDLIVVLPPVDQYFSRHPAIGKLLTKLCSQGLTFVAPVAETSDFHCEAAIELSLFAENPVISGDLTDIQKEKDRTESRHGVFEISFSKIVVPWAENKKFELPSFVVEDSVLIAGPIGSGKSVLLRDLIYASFAPSPARGPSIVYGNVKFSEQISTVRYVPCCPEELGSRNARRSAIRTVMGLLGVERSVAQMFARLPKARALNLTEKDFVRGSSSYRCPHCHGTGISVRLEFEPSRICEACFGSGFKGMVEEILFGEHTIGDINLLTVRNAVGVFSDKNVVYEKLTMCDLMGLSERRLGEVECSLSSAEFAATQFVASYCEIASGTAAEVGSKARRKAKVGGQRRRSASSRSNGIALYLFDDPFDGLSTDVRIYGMALLERLLQNDEKARVILTSRADAMAGPRTGKVDLRPFLLV